MLIVLAAVTPLDVVRVRLQSQQPTPARSTPPTSQFTAARAPTLTSFSNLPPNIGISACCREVFWINNNAPYCVAGPTVNTSALKLPAIDPSCAAEETQRRNFTSTFDGLRKIARHEGPTTLWRGLSPTLLMAIPANVIYLSGYDWLRHSPRAPFQGRLPDTYIPLAAGSTARVLAALAVSPIEMFRTRMQATRGASGPAGHFRETLDGMRRMIATEGAASLWRGLSLTLWRDVPFSAIYWWGYETGRNALTDARGRRAERDDAGPPTAPLRESGRERYRRRSRSRSRQGNTGTLVDSFVAGAASGAVAALVTTPFDVGKTRQQVVRYGGDGAAAAAAAAASASGHAGPLRPEERSMPRFLAHIFREQGVQGLFRGWAARCLKVAPACAIMISCYEVGKKMARGVNAGGGPGAEALGLEE